MQRSGRGPPAVAPRARPAIAAPGRPVDCGGLMVFKRSRPVLPPTPHSSGARPPDLPTQALPRHVAIVMDGNGRWAKERGLPRTKGHERGEYSLFDTIEGAIELGIPYLSAYAFSTENWKRSPEEVRFLMGFN